MAGPLRTSSSSKFVQVVGQRLIDFCLLQVDGSKYHRLILYVHIDKYRNIHLKTTPVILVQSSYAMLAVNDLRHFAVSNNGQSVGCFIKAGVLRRNCQEHSSWESGIYVMYVLPDF